MVLLLNLPTTFKAFRSMERDKRLQARPGQLSHTLPLLIESPRGHCLGFSVIVCQTHKDQAMVVSWAVANQERGQRRVIYVLVDDEGSVGKVLPRPWRGPVCSQPPRCEEGCWPQGWAAQAFHFGHHLAS